MPQKRVDHKGDNVLEPLYAIQNAAGALSDLTSWVTLFLSLRLTQLITTFVDKCRTCEWADRIRYT